MKNNMTMNPTHQDIPGTGSMNNRHRLLSRIALSVAGATLALAARAEGPEATPFRDGAYLAVLGTGVVQAKHNDLGTGYGGTLGIGYRSGWYALELAPTFVKFKGTQQRGGGVNALIFPLTSPWLSNVYLIGGVAALQYAGFSTTSGTKDFNTLNLQGGLGALLPLHIGNYQFGIRSEVLYRYGDRERIYNDQDTDISAPRHFNQIVLNIGLQLPFKSAHPPAAPTPPPEPVEVVPATPVAPPPEPVAPPPPPAPVCKTPGVGEKVSLDGCGTGDHIVLRGVNFDTDKSILTANAKTLLDDVSSELQSHPAIKVEVDGHTDIRASAKHNQALSERRAASVRDYLIKSGIAADRIGSAGFGATMPIADNGTDEGRELNRRVELKIVDQVSAPAAVAHKAAKKKKAAAPVAEAPAAEAPAAEAPAEAAPAEAAPAEAAPAAGN